MRSSSSEVGRRLSGRPVASTSNVSTAQPSRSVRVWCMYTDTYIVDRNYRHLEIHCCLSSEIRSGIGQPVCSLTHLQRKAISSISSPQNVVGGIYVHVYMYSRTPLIRTPLIRHLSNRIDTFAVPNIMCHVRIQVLRITSLIRTPH